MNRQYYYTTYQRIWHWLQAVVILAMVLSGLEVHFPESVHLFGFAGAVRWHNTAAFILLANAFLGFFYYLTTGELRQHLPQLRDLLAGIFQQAKYYLRGFFRGEPHPHHKQPQSRLNPLQRVTYSMVLNVLLPLQAVTGLLIWGGQHWPGLLERVGGLRVVAGVHSLGAWLFIAFLLLHLYLITTGQTPFANLVAMVRGWEPVEQPVAITMEMKE